MDINRLNEFIVLATNLNYSKAANQLYMTQPALSRHIHDLEATLGAKLLTRDTHNVRLTPVGELFYEEAKVIVERYNHAIELVQQAIADTSGKLKVGFLGAAVQPFLGKFTMEFSTKHPTIDLQLHSSTLDLLMQSLNKDELDLCFITHVSSDSLQGFESQTLLKDKILVAIHPNHPLAARQSLSLIDLSGLNLIGLDPATGPIVNDYHKRLFKKANSKPNISAEVPNIETALFFVEINKGFFLIPEHLRFIATNVATVPISDDFCYIDLNIVWKKDNSNPSLALFRKEFSKFMRNLEDPYY